MAGFDAQKCPVKLGDLLGGIAVFGLLLAMLWLTPDAPAVSPSDLGAHR